MARGRCASRIWYSQWAIAGALLLAACASPKVRHARPAASTAPPPRAMSESGQSFTIYQVQPGDTLNKIAAQYQISAATLASWNGISDPNLIRVNTRLRVPTPGSLPAPVPPPVGAPPPATAREVFAPPSPEELSGVSFPPAAPAPAESAEVPSTPSPANEESASHRMVLPRP